MNKIVTLERQYGSGGHDIGKLLAGELGVRFYDNELITLAASESGVSEKLFAGIDEKATNSILYSMSVGLFNYGKSPIGIPEPPLNDKLFIATSDIIFRLAEQGPCVIVGRCADYILRERADCVKLFVYADMDYRIKRVMDEENLTQDKAKELILKKDKKRATYYNYYSDRKWGKIENYDIAFNSSVGVEKSVAFIRSYLNII